MTNNQFPITNGQLKTTDLITDFDHELRLQGRSEATRYLYRVNVIRFLDAVELPARQVCESDIKEYISSLYKENYALNTIKIAIKSLRRFYRFLHVSGGILINPTKKIKEPSAKRRFPRSVLSANEMERIRRSLPRSSLLKYRDKAIIEVLYSTGLRLSELTHLNITDVNLTDGLVLIRRGKGGGERRAILNSSAIKILGRYLDLRQQIPDESPALWINYRGEKLARDGVGKIVKEAAERAGLTKSGNPHAWRHGIATELLRRGATLREIQVFLGHKSIRTTEIYTHLTIKDLIRIHSRTHPRELDPIPPQMPTAFSGGIHP